MARLIDISKFDVFDFQLQEDQTLEFAYGAQWMLEQIDKEPIVNAIPLPNNATNGDVIKALFPNEKVVEVDHACTYVGAIMRFDTDWWNAPYTKEQNNE